MSDTKIITVSLNPAIDRTLQANRIVLGDHLSAREVCRTPGGKGVNVSRTLSAMGISSIATGFLGSENRNEFEGFLADPLVEDRFVVLPGRTRENITITDLSTGVDTHIRDQGLAIGHQTADKFTSELEKISPGALVVFSGSLPPGISPEAFGQMLATCNKTGARVVVDTSSHALKTAAQTKLFLAKPNTAELGELLQRDIKTRDELLSAGRQLCANVENVLVSRGAQGAILITQDQAIEASCPQCYKPVVNTVGCGDVMLGSFIAGLVKDMSLADSLKLAIANSCACAYNQAAAVFDKRLAENFFKEIQIQQV